MRDFTGNAGGENLQGKWFSKEGGKGLGVIV